MTTFQHIDHISNHLPPTTGPRPGGATVTMLVEHDVAIFQYGQIEVVEVVLARYFQVEHLVEVAVVEEAVPADGDGVAAHDAADGAGIEGVEQALHVVFVLAVVEQKIEKPADRHVGDGVKAVELHIVLAFELALELGFEPVVPPLRNRIEPWEYNREMYKRRNEVERLFRRLKGFRRIFSRFEKLDVMFLGFISFALVADGLRLC